MDKKQELQNEIKKLQNELHEITVAENAKQKKKMVGKYYMQWHDVSDHYTEYTHVLWIDNFGNLYGDTIKVSDWPKNDDKISIVGGQMLNWENNLKFAREIKPEKFANILQKLEDNVRIIQMKMYGDKEEEET